MGAKSPQKKSEEKGYNPIEAEVRPRASKLKKYFSQDVRSKCDEEDYQDSSIEKSSKKSEGSIKKKRSYDNEANPGNTDSFMYKSK